MKKQNFLLAVVVFVVLAFILVMTSCSSYTCPAYSKGTVQKGKMVQPPARI